MKGNAWASRYGSVRYHVESSSSMYALVRVRTICGKEEREEVDVQPEPDCLQARARSKNQARQRLEYRLG